MADAVALMGDVTAELKPAVRGRLGMSRGLFALPPAGTYYLSKMAVDPELRGQGRGPAVLRAFLATGRDLGYSSFALDVAAANAAAVRIYEHAGFTRVAESVTGDGAMRYVSMEIRVDEEGAGV